MNGEPMDFVSLVSETWRNYPIHSYPTKDSHRCGSFPLVTHGNSATAGGSVTRQVTLEEMEKFVRRPRAALDGSSDEKSVFST